MMPNEMEEEIMDEAGDVWNPKVKSIPLFSLQWKLFKST